VREIFLPKKSFIFRLPFSFSLKKEEFDSLKKEPNYGINDYCENLKVCQMTDSKCLKVADYSVAWARTKDYVSNFVLLSKEYFLETGLVID